MPHQLGLALPAPQRIDRTTCPRWQAGKQLPHHHGSENAYCLGCRCDDAREVRRIRVKRRREHRATSEWVDPTGSVRRLRGLAVMGWGLADVAAAGGFTNIGTVQQIRGGRRTWIFRSRASAIEDVCRRLGTTTGPKPRATAHALRQGWEPLAAWDDDIDDPAATPGGKPINDNHVEFDEPDENAPDALWIGRVSWDDMAPQDREYAAWRLSETWSAAAIARETRVTRRTVERALHAARTRWGRTDSLTQAA